MQRGHLEDAFLAQLVGSDLQDDREALNHEYPTDKRQQELLFNDHSHGADSSAQRKRANVTHEDLRRMRVIPEKADTGPDHGAAEDRQLGGLPHALDFTILSKHGAYDEIGQSHTSSRRQPPRAPARA